MKLITVVIPNYNCEDYLDRCIDSIVSQTYSNLEIIICDNGSTDNSVAIIKKWADSDKRIQLIINEENQGLINCYNKMFFAATGEYVAIMDADDWSDVTRMEKQAAILEKHDVGLCLTNAVYYKYFEEPQITLFGESGKIGKESEEIWAPATIMFRRMILNEINGYHQYFHRLTSYDRYFVLCILDMYGGYYLNEPLYHVWARAASDHRSLDIAEPNFLRKAISHDIYKELKTQRLTTGTDCLKEGKMDEMQKMEHQKLSDKDYIADKLRTIACIQIYYGSYNEGWKLLKESIRKSPFLLDNYKSLFYLLRSKFGGKKIVTESVVEKNISAATATL